jgi:hypothetical protein
MSNAGGARRRCRETVHAIGDRPEIPTVSTRNAVDFRDKRKQWPVAELIQLREKTL